MRLIPNREVAQACGIGVVILVLMILSGLRPMPRPGKGLASSSQKEPTLAAPLLSSGSIPDSAALHRISYQGSGREPALPLAASRLPQFRAPRAGVLNAADEVLAAPEEKIRGSTSGSSADGRQ